MSTKLIFRHRQFTPLLWTQFFGALNDNFYKNALIILMTYTGVSLWGMNAAQLVAFAGGVFILPFFLFSALSGQISDKLPKRKIVLFTKWFELGIMIVASVGFLTHHFSLLIVGLFCMGLHSTIFGPVKYSMLPDLLLERELTHGNAFVETGTFLAILVGTILGGLITNSVALCLGLIAVSGLGLLTAHFVPHVHAADPDHKMEYHPIRQITQATRHVQHHPTLQYSVIGISWFWFLGAGVLSILPVMTKDWLHAEHEVVTLFLASFTVGIALGAFMCSKFSKHGLALWPVAVGALGMTLALFDLAWSVADWSAAHRLAALGEDARALLTFTDFINETDGWRIMGALVGVAISGGLFTVPLFTLMQQRTERRVRSRIVAANNIFNALFMVLSSVLLMAFYAWNWSMPKIIVTYGILNLFNLVLMLWRAPEFRVRMK